ncbi:MAG: ATP-binding protein [Pseudolysinimonas sp.]|uniref:ATP-binding protein n=1 Tax=Pseudolysinimonas sp. TaxID=2680009 RepID=UPI003C764DAD
MALKTSLGGRVRNTSLPKSHSLLPLLEAVVNGLQAIDTRFSEDVSGGRLKVTIEREGQGEFDFGPAGPGRVALRPITGFQIEDNGVGFTTENMTSFETLDSEFKADIGGRGVGRLLWLKTFDRVSVRSTYQDDDGEIQSRAFKFSVEGEVEHGEALERLAEPGTVVVLDGFKNAFQQSARKSGEAIAREIFEHCIWYFLRPGGAPQITVVDDEAISLNTMMDEFAFSELPRSTVEVKGVKFDMVSLRLKSSAPVPKLYWCAANRVVLEENLAGKIPGLFGRLKDEDSTEFTYVCYLSSDFLDTFVRSDRTDFDITERLAGTPLEDDLTMEDIRTAVLREAERLLAGPLGAARAEGKERVSDFVSQRAPRYRPVFARMESRGFTVDPTLRDSDLEIVLHRALRTIEDETLVEGQAVFAEVGSVPIEDYKERLDNYIETITEINQSDLAAYVSRRRVVLDLLRKLVKSNDSGGYSREDAIHSLLIPMRVDSNDIGPDASNLWIIDERLAFHEYLASDKTLRSMPVIGSDSTKEPDVLALRRAPVLVSEGPNPPLASIVVVEIKRPMRNDASGDKNPIDQTLEYVKLVRSGGVKTATGRPIPSTPEPPAFCYIVADLTQTMIAKCENANLQKTEDGMGFFGYNGPAKAYIEVMSFDRLVNSATQRNRAFFDKLGLPSS